MYIAISITAAFLVTFILLPIIIKVSRSIDLMDIPDRRKIHAISTPSLGGIAIFGGFILGLLMALPFAQLVDIKYFLSGLLVIFILGVRDDISSLLAKHKLFTQIFAAFLVAQFSELHFTGLYGMMGIGEMPGWFNLALSIFVIVGLTNSFNLIDGIDGLAGALGALICFIFGCVFILADAWAYAIVSFALMGSLIAFLFYNWHPSKVFMGDTGSLILGYTITVFGIHFINIAPGTALWSNWTIDSSVGICVGLFILPIYDTLRVFFIRFKNGKSPLDPDRNHLHHGLLKLGYNHSKATIILISTNILIFALGLYLDRFLANGELVLSLLTITFILVLILDLKLRRKSYLGKSGKVSNQDLYISKSA